MTDLDDARRKIKETGADGIMLGRAIFGNPWLFSESHSSGGVTIPERLTAMVEHTRLFHTLLGDVKGFSVMKKHYKAYVHGFDGSKGLRVRLMGTETPDEVAAMVEEFLSCYTQ